MRESRLCSQADRVDIGRGLAARGYERLSRSATFRLSQRMKLSARNVLKGRIIKIVDGAVNCEVTLEIAPGVEVVAIITKASVQALELAVGRDAFAVIKASSVMVAVE